MGERTRGILPLLVLIFSVLYFLSPIDILPDIAPPLTWVDDFGLLGFALWYYFRGGDD